MSDSSTYGGASFTSLLQLTFIILKLCGVIAWSWWWVLSPTWIGISIVGLVLLVVIIHVCLQDQKSKRYFKEKRQTQSRWQQRMEEIKKAK